MEKDYAMATQERTVRGRRFSDRFIAGVLRVFSRVHITLYRWTGGIIGERIFGNRMLLLTTTGCKTGQPRTKPVAYLVECDPSTLFMSGNRESILSRTEVFQCLQQIIYLIIRTLSSKR